MNFLKILLLSSVFLFTNCSLVNDKLISRSEKKNENIEDNNSEEQEQEKEQDIVMERVYIEDEKDISSQEGLQGDIKNQGNIEDYPNLADVPNRPDPTISEQEQNEIIKSIEGKSQLEPMPNISVKTQEIQAPDVQTSFNETKERNFENNLYKDPDSSIRNILDSKLNEIENFKPAPSTNDPNMTQEEYELHALAKELKNIDTKEKIDKVEEKIKKNDLYYTPQDIDEILGLKSSSIKKEKIIKKEEVAIKKKKNVNEEISKQVIIDKETEITKTTIGDREVPVARVTFNHGSVQLSNDDILKIKNVANLFIQNEGKKIVIVGHASSRTNYDMDLTEHALVNFNISLERARKVMRQFSSIGLNSKNIELVAMSDAKPLYAEIMPSLEAANRRAEIFIKY